MYSYSVRYVINVFVVCHVIYTGTPLERGPI